MAIFRRFKTLPLVMIIGILFSIFSGCGASNDLLLTGTVESTQIAINSEVSGKVLKLTKEEGEIVKTGDILAVVDPAVQEYNVKQQEAVVKLKGARLEELKAGTRSEQIAQAEASVKSAKAKLDELKAGTRPEQIKQAQAAVNTSVAAVDSARANVQTADTNYFYWSDKYNKINTLYEMNAISETELTDIKNKADNAKQQLSAAQEQLKGSEAQLQSARAQLELLQNGATKQSIEAAQAGYEQALAQLDQLRNGSTSQTIKAAEAELEQSVAAMEQSKLTLGKYNIKSSIDGTYLYRNINIGDIVNAGTSIGSVSDLHDLWVKVYLPQKHLSAIALNQEINLTSPALPGKTIKGSVVFIASEAEYTPKNTETNEAKENTVFKIKVKILDHIDVLKPGMTVDTRITLKR